MSALRIAALLSCAALVACSAQPDPARTDAKAAAQQPDPRLEMDAAPPARQTPPQQLTGIVSPLTGVVTGVTGEVSPLQGLVDALGGTIVDSEIRIALPADTLFAFDQAVVLPAAEPNLRTLAELIGKTQGAVRLDGYTDAKGDDDYNLGLSKRRADAVRDWLAGNGVDRARLESIGRGEADPVAPNTRPDGSDDPEGRARNRRVEAILAAP